MIFIGYRREIGRDDVEGISEFIEKNKEFTKVYIVYKEPLTEVVRELLKDKNFHLIQTDNLRKTLRELKAKGKNKTFFLDEFGRRKLGNPCGRNLSRPQYW